MEARRQKGRLGGAPVAADGGVLPRDRGQLRVPDLLALLPGRHHRVRGPRHRDHGHQLLRRRHPAHRHRRRRPDLRPVPPALHRRAHGHGDRRTGHRRGVREHRPCRSPTPTPTAWRWCSAAGRCSPSPRASRTWDWASQRGWKVVNRGSPSTGWAHRRATSSSRRRPSPRWSTPTRSSCGGPRSSTTPSGSRPSPRRSDGRRVLQPEPWLRRSPEVDGGRPADRRHRHRPVARLRHPPHPAAGGLARHAGGHGLVLAGPWGFFDRNPALDVPPNPARCH